MSRFVIWSFGMLLTLGGLVALRLGQPEILRSAFRGGEHIVAAVHGAGPD